MNVPTELDRFLCMMQSLRTYPISVVFGNLGRQPFLLTHYLDKCFGSQEKVRVLSPWPLPSRYAMKRLDSGSIDFLFLLEPYFGYTVQKRPNVAHLIVLTSHLSLCVPAQPIHYAPCFLSTFGKYDPPTRDDLENWKTFIPKMYHVDASNRDGFEKPSVWMDVRGKSAHETYLKILTGRERIRLPYKIRIDQRVQDIIETHVRLSKQKADLLWKGNDIPHAYWNVFSQ